MGELSDAGQRPPHLPQEITITTGPRLEKTKFERGDQAELTAMHPLALKFAQAHEVTSFFKTNQPARQLIGEQTEGETVCEGVRVKKISWGKEWYKTKDRPPEQRDSPQPFDAPRVVYKTSLQRDGKRENVYLKVFLGNTETQENIARFLESESRQGNKAIPESAVTKVDDAVILVQKEAPGRQLRDKFEDLKDAGDAETAQEHLKKIAQWLAEFQRSNSGVDNLPPSDIQAESNDFNRYVRTIQALLPQDSASHEAFGQLEQFMPVLKEAANNRTGTDYPSHNGFRPGHIYITDDPEDVALIDWDRAVKGSPAKDVAVFMNELGYMRLGHIDGVDLREFFLDQYKSHSALDIDASLDIYSIFARLQNDKELKTAQGTERTLAFVNEKIGSLRDNLRDDLDEETLQQIDTFQELLGQSS